MTETNVPAQASDKPIGGWPESWRTSDISWICHHLKEHTIFDVDRLQREWNEMKAIAIASQATPRATADVERDAARYQFLTRELGGSISMDLGLDCISEIDEHIDAAIAATKGASHE